VLQQKIFRQAVLVSPVRMIYEALMSQHCYASIDLGGTNIKGILGREDGQVLARRSIPTLAEQGPDAVLGRIAELVDSLAEEAGERPQALGMGCPGLVDVQQGISRFFPNLPTQWRDVAIAEHLAPGLGCPVYILNDVRMATLGEQRFGHGQDVDSFVFFALGTGIGGGIVIDKKLRLGPLAAAGEIGHLTMVPDGHLCGCGNRGCLETIASGSAIAAEGVRLIKCGHAPRLFEIIEGDTTRISAQTMTEAALAGDPHVQASLMRVGRFLGIAVANMVLTLHPELVVFGGGVAGMGELLTDRVKDVLEERVNIFPVSNIAIKTSKLGHEAGAMGGIALAMEGRRLVGAEV
jgi:glucokinase